MNDWQLAYAAIAGVAATLSGLLFVALSMRLAAADASERRWMLFMAKRSFVDFLAVLALALLFLMPKLTLQAVGWTQLVLGASRVAWHVRHWRMSRSLAAKGRSLREYLAPVGATLALLVAGGGALLAWPDVLKTTYIAALMLLFGACQNAWRLLVG